MQYIWSLRWPAIASPQWEEVGGGLSGMRREYDFTSGQRGQFFHAQAVFEMPVSLALGVTTFEPIIVEERTTMQHITALGFDLFETLVLVQHLRREEAISRLTQSLTASGLSVEADTFLPVYRTAARHFMSAAQQEGVETHNRFWVSAALQELGHTVAPDDPHITEGVERYFSAFVDYAVPIPGTREMLEQLHTRYRLGLVSNLTHAPAALQILDKLGLTPFFDTIIVSGQHGYRKPHPQIFTTLVEHLGAGRTETAFVGDNLDADVRGAQQAGLQPIWMAYTQAQGLSTPPETPPAVPTITAWPELLTLLAGR